MPTWHLALWGVYQQLSSWLLFEGNFLPQWQWVTSILQWHCVAPFMHSLTVCVEKLGGLATLHYVGWLCQQLSADRHVISVVKLCLFCCVCWLPALCWPGVVLRVDSPGGDALASDLMWREIRQLAEKKPVVACMGDVAASGGYYMSMAAQVGNLRRPVRLCDPHLATPNPA